MSVFSMIIYRKRGRLKTQLANSVRGDGRTQLTTSKFRSTAFTTGFSSHRSMCAVECPARNAPTLYPTLIP